MRQPTSKTAYTQAKKTSQLAQSQASALVAVRRHGPATSAEIIRRGKLGANTNLWRARFTELKDRGMIVATGKRRCSITGRVALVWQDSKRTVPLPYRKPLSAAAWRRLATDAGHILHAMQGQLKKPLDSAAIEVLAAIHRAQRAGVSPATSTK